MLAVMRFIPSALAVFVFAGPALAQVAPGLSVPMRPSAVFDLNGPLAYMSASGSTQLIGISAVPVQGSTSNQWLVGLTLRGPAAFAPGIGSNSLADLVIGIYTPQLPGSPTAGTFTLTGDEVNLNTGSGDRSIQFDASGLNAVFERINRVSSPGGSLVVIFDGVFFTQRPSTSVPFPAAQRVTGIRGIGGSFTASPGGTGAAADPAIGYVSGRLKLFYFGVIATSATTAVQGILMDDLVLDPTFGPLSGFNPQLVALPSTPAFVLHSPTPVIGADGDVEGLWFAEANLATNNSDMWFADDLDPNTPAVRVFASQAGNPKWKNNGALVGGQFLASDEASGNHRQITEAWGAWLVGDVERVGSPNPIDLTVGGVPSSPVFAFLSTSLASPPVPGPPGSFGQIGLGGPVATLGLFVLDTWGRGSLSFATPTNPSLSGTRWPVQAVSFDPTGAIVLTNTAHIDLL